MKNDVRVPLNDRIWKEYRTKLHRFILNRVNDPLIAEDIVQEVLLKAFEHLDGLEDQQKILSWIYQITRNAIIDYYRRRSPTEELHESLIMQNIDMKEDVEKDLASCIMPLLEQLPPHYREALTLSEINGFTQKEVALKQGVSLSGAKSRVQRGRKMLKKVLLECCKIERGQRGSIIDYEPNENCSNCS
ncbi:MAG: RNA polymerase sigma factor SigZ [bacterium]